MLMHHRAASLFGLALDFYTLSVSMASGAYIRTDNPKSGLVQDEYAEHRRLTATPSQQDTRSPNIPGDGPLSFPSTPRVASSEDDRTSNHPELTPGLDMSGNEAELHFLGPSSAYQRATGRGFNPLE
jgi:hypothetical protein